MKRILPLLLSLCFMVQMLPSAFAQTHAEVSFTSASAMCGEDVTTTVSIKNCVDAKSIMIIPQYDEDILEIVSGTWLIDGVLAEDWGPAFGDAVIAFSANTDVNTDIFEFVFRVKDDAKAGQVANVGCEIVITTMDGNEDIPVAVTVTEGLVTVLATECSHIDENGDYICDDCGENLCTEHTEKIISGYDATCTEDGLTEGKKCANCGEILVKQEVIIALGHTYDDGVVTTEPTCTETGVMTYTCLRRGCDYSVTEAISAQCHSAQYQDLNSNAWYHEYVDYMLGAGLMNGVNAEKDMFDPSGEMTRAMLVTVLWRAQGEPAVEGENPFADVADGKWYTDAIIWAVSEGIVTGITEDTFAPNSSVTREQIACILWRLAGKVGANGTLESFPDGDTVSTYAVEAMAWAVEGGLLKGDDQKNLNPTATATRAEVATLIYHYMK